jgi:imidazole glycerol-phosphate synthase subunit HisH
VTTALIDYGAGNLHSVASALRAAGADDVVLTNDTKTVLQADRIVLPGVGAYAACMGALDALEGMVEALEARVRRDAVPFLGICVGMQLLADRGVEHGGCGGLGWISGEVVPIVPTAPSIKIPHMGWNAVELDAPHTLLEKGEAYFLHSYQFCANNPATVLAHSRHGGKIVAAVGVDNIIGVQFHPEKSQRFGLAFLSRFLEWKP